MFSAKIKTERKWLSMEIVASNDVKPKIKEVDNNFVFFDLLSFDLTEKTPHTWLLDPWTQ